ncbi:SDR family mycofactocin-dependent oxidoreductase [Nocardioides sp. J2M5]|uniref:mycofactocin-coupled SDR family oxidoreductase n=1 Tax=Nocardioides palaemonis TaxID=2829810 RepID=UPI001BABE072|nr:mycofactocin-coupled SDR family oxidoreductase [Nocardioides palaemonis]MBS2939411.1 SDR family mycofactocin-dependent oxidoreductase [Nocardioides palaemonis]
MAEERVALVTGAASGIGAAVVARLAGRGMRVVALDVAAGPGGLPGAGYPLPTPADLEDVVAPLGDRAVPVVADVRDADAVDAAAALAVERWGRLDVAVAAAALVAGGRPLWEDDSLPLLWAVDVAGTWHTASAAVPRMLAGPDPSGCRFVALSSVAGSRGLFHLAAYTTAKHAVDGLVRGLAADLAGTGVVAMAVAPGATRTPMLAATARLYGVTEDELAGHQVAGVLEPDDLAATVEFCCTPEGRALHGSVVRADGGFG